MLKQIVFTVIYAGFGNCSCLVEVLLSFLTYKLTFLEMAMIVTLLMLGALQLSASANSEQLPRFELPVIYDPRILEDGCPNDQARTVVEEEVRGVIRNTILAEILPGLQQNRPANSCSEIAEQNSRQASGVYWIRSSNGTAVQVYCDMDRVCGCNNTRGWARVAYLNMTDPSQRCPGAWRLITTPRRTCGRATQNLACDSAIFPSNGIQYTHVCGRVIGYHVVSPDAFNYPIRFNPSFTTDNPYLDGVSITHGASGSRQHIWSFAGGLGDPALPDSYHCPCHGNVNPPSFVGQDYFCETANDAMLPWPSLGFEVNDPLWDGRNCSVAFSCECTLNNPP